MIEEVETMIFKTNFFGFLVIAIILTGCVSTQDVKMIEHYANELEPYLGSEAGEIIPLVIDRWEFTLQARWADTNPTPEKILEKNHRRAPFSRKEAEEIFKEKGDYNVLILAKKGSEDATIEAEMDEGMGAGYHEHVHKYTHYIFVRFVFLNKKLHNFRCFHAQIIG
jgi:hypothetical protein